MYNLFSLGAGFLSWGLGAAALCRRDRSILPVSCLSLPCKGKVFYILVFFCCRIILNCLQLFKVSFSVLL